MIGAKGKDSGAGLGLAEGQGIGGSEALYGVEDAGRIVHHTERIDHGTELLFGEAVSEIVGEAAAYEQHPLARRELPASGWYVYDSSKVHE